MRSLNEHAGTGYTIPIPSVPLTSLVSPGELMAMSKNEMKDLTDRKEKQEAEGCSESVASLYDGKPCMGTSIHARVPNSCFCDGLSLITNICSIVTKCRLNLTLTKHSMRVLEVHTSNISKRTTIVYMMAA